MRQCPRSITNTAVIRLSSAWPSAYCCRTLAAAHPTSPEQKATISLGSSSIARSSPNCAPNTATASPPRSHSSGSEPISTTYAWLENSSSSAAASPAEITRKHRARRARSSSLGTTSDAIPSALRRSAHAIHHHDRRAATRRPHRHPAHSPSRTGVPDHASPNDAPGVSPIAGTGRSRAVGSSQRGLLASLS